MAEDNVRFEREVRGIPLWLLREYLEEAGGHKVSEGHVEGEGWTAHLRQLEDFQLGSLRVGQVWLELVGQAEPMQRLQAIMEKKLLRAGG